MEHEIKCPKCGTVFTIDEAGYANIVQQVRNGEFEHEIAERTRLLENTYEEKLNASQEMKEKDLELAKKETAESYQKEISQKNAEIAELKAEMMEMKSEMATVKTKERLAVAEATSKIEREMLEKTAKLERERDGLKKDLENAKAQEESKTLMVRQGYEQQLKMREEEIERLKDFKAKLSTKMVGETLEQHCQNEFNSIRATAFPRAEFGKDNKVSESGSKGDFIFRDFDEEGNEIVSIMFEMKNENDTTATKHKNEHFFKELDKDRKEKNCEYAVLVSLLEGDSELYNRGIVDVSYEYPKMFVIRPQFFLAMIGIITNVAKNAMGYKTELMRVQNQNIDITNFEDKLKKFKESFMLNSERAAKNFNKAIEDIDKSIKNLENTKQALIQTVKNFGTAEKKLDDLTVKRLTRGNETMKKMFDELEGDKKKAD